jgi:hypothetical protein
MQGVRLPVVCRIHVSASALKGQIDTVHDGTSMVTLRFPDSPRGGAEAEFEALFR